MSDRERLLVTKSVNLNKKKCLNIIKPNYIESQDQLNNMIELLEILLTKLNEDLKTHKYKPYINRQNNLESNKQKGMIRAIIKNEIINQRFKESKECSFKSTNSY